MRTCIVVADGSRARFFIFDTSRDTLGAHVRRELEELRALANPEGESTGNESFSSARSGSNRAPPGAAFEYDDHHERHREEIARRFARVVATETAGVVARQRVARLVLAATPHLLGLLRPELLKLLPACIDQLDLAEDLTRHTPEQILHALRHHHSLRVRQPD